MQGCATTENDSHLQCAGERAVAENDSHLRPGDSHLQKLLRKSLYIHCLLLYRDPASPLTTFQRVSYTAI